MLRAIRKELNELSCASLRMQEEFPLNVSSHAPAYSETVRVKEVLEDVDFFSLLTENVSFLRTTKQSK